MKPGASFISALAPRVVSAKFSASPWRSSILFDEGVVRSLLGERTFEQAELVDSKFLAPHGDVLSEPLVDPMFGCVPDARQGHVRMELPSFEFEFRRPETPRQRALELEEGGLFDGAHPEHFRPPPQRKHSGARELERKRPPIDVARHGHGLPHLGFRALAQECERQVQTLAEGEAGLGEPLVDHDEIQFDRLGDRDGKEQPGHQWQGSTRGQICQVRAAFGLQESCVCDFLLS